ncbi:protein IL-40 isoform X2 [Castor canadensis]|uniref:Protein IL-40 isoform X2 n=1 Tax=Castor canadensis TaxID=51338 RepID=A0AC58K879_CASCN
MRLLSLFCLAMLAPSSFPKKQAEEATPEISIAYQVLKVYPRGRQVRITCNASQAPPPVTYSLLASRDMQVDKKVMDTHKPASFNINITLKSSPDLLTYFCQAASSLGVHGPSARLQMYWELWAKPVSQVQVDFTLQDRESGPRAEMSCQASSGSPPISYLLVGKNGRVYMQQRPHHGQPANFQLSGMWGWFQCQAENSVSVQSSAFKLVPPVQLPLVPTSVLAGSLFTIAAITCWMVRTRL